MAFLEMGRLVRLVSIGFSQRSLGEVVALARREASWGCDLILLPETWRGNTTESLKGESITAMAEVCQEFGIYIVCPIWRGDSEGRRWNSAVVLGRQGEVVGVYDKVYPYWAEFDLQPPCTPGSDIPVFETDFGRLGIAICFDVNFPEIWQILADKGAELVVWPSAYSAGTSLQAHALNYHYYIVTATHSCDCLAYDITGKELHSESKRPVNVSRLTVDLDRGLYHQNFNLDKLEKLLAEQGSAVELELSLEKEQWFVLRTKQAGVSARELAKRYGLEELRDYLARSRREINKRRNDALK